MYMFCNSNKVEFFKMELEKLFTVKNMIIWVKNKKPPQPVLWGFWFDLS